MHILQICGYSFCGLLHISVLQFNVNIQACCKNTRKYLDTAKNECRLIESTKIGIQPAWNKSSIWWNNWHINWFLHIISGLSVSCIAQKHDNLVCAWEYRLLTWRKVDGAQSYIYIYIYIYLFIYSWIFHISRIMCSDAACHFTTISTWLCRPICYFNINDDCAYFYKYTYIHHVYNLISTIKEQNCCTIHEN